MVQIVNRQIEPRSVRSGSLCCLPPQPEPIPPDAVLHCMTDRLKAFRFVKPEWQELSWRTQAFNFNIVWLLCDMTVELAYGHNQSGSTSDTKGLSSYESKVQDVFLSWPRRMRENSFDIARMHDEW